MKETRKAIIELIGDYMDKTVLNSDLLIVKSYKEWSFLVEDEIMYGNFDICKNTATKNVNLWHLINNNNTIDKNHYICDICYPLRGNFNNAIYERFWNIFKENNDFLETRNELFKDKNKLAQELKWKIYKLAYGCQELDVMRKNEQSSNIKDCLELIDIYEMELSPVFKLLWHYDITAVEKYIIWLNKSYDIQIDTDSDWEEKYILYFWKYVSSFPNKPLHLYSEQEEKDLLDLLLKLK